MVTFKLVEENDRFLIYWYFPQGDEEKRHGVIVVDKVDEIVKITDLAEDDWKRDIPPEEVNKLIDAINEMKAERGETDFEEHVSVTGHSIFFGDHAVRRIVEELNKGNIPPKGIAAWY